MATITPKELAVKLGTDPRTLRKFLRSVDSVDSPGKGGRYAIDTKRVASLKKGFNTWIAAKEAKKAESPAEG